MIPLFKVAMSPEAPARVAEVLQSGYIGQGEMVEQFERALQTLLDLDAPPLSTNSCTSAIDLALHLIGIGPGDEVITTPVTCTATNSPIVTRGAVPVWADVDPYTGLIDPLDVALKLTPRTKAIMAVDWGGQLSDYAMLKTHGLPVIQDAAHHLSPPAGDYACYSFQAIKFLTCGDGGALWCPPDQLERARLLRWYGLDRRSTADFRCEQNIQEAGYKYHMNDIAAAIGLANIGSTKELIARQQMNAIYYDRQLESYEVMRAPLDYRSACWLYTLLVEDRPGFIRHMAKHGVACSPVHARNDTHAAFHFPNGPLPGVDHFASRNVAIPVGWWLSEDDRRQVVEAVKAWT
jgi:dTDP-4-amino-4,6-dideoxy-D-glucose/dTDP-4-amino-2,4-dideoxy-beta-L-xylose transaminase